MRVLFTCVVGHGHFQPMVPLAEAFRAAGHEIAVATDPAYCAAVRDQGFFAYPAGLDHPVARARFLESVPQFAATPIGDRMRLQQAEMFGRIRVPPMLRDLAPIIADWQPALLIHDSLEMAGAIAAEAAGIAHAEHSVGIVRPLAGRQASTEAVAPFSKALGVANPGVGGLGGELYLDICPPGLQSPEAGALANVQRLRPMDAGANADAPLPDWLTGTSDQPVVYVTMGTVFNEDLRVFATILDGLLGEPVRVLVTVGETVAPDALGPRPANVHVERYVPQARVLPRCSLMISHGGSGAMLGAVKAGVPMLAVPQGADQFMNAARIDAAGLGLRLLPDEFDAASVRRAARLLLSDPSYRTAARAEQRALESMPLPRDVVPILEALASGGSAG